MYDRLSLELFSACRKSAPGSTSGPACYRFHMCPSTCSRRVTVKVYCGAYAGPPGPTHPLPPPPLASCNCRNFEQAPTPPSPLSSLRLILALCLVWCVVPRLSLTRSVYSPARPTLAQYQRRYYHSRPHTQRFPFPARIWWVPSPPLTPCNFRWDTKRARTRARARRGTRALLHSHRACLAHATHAYSSGAAASFAFGEPKSISRLHMSRFLSVTHAAISD